VPLHRYWFKVCRTLCNLDGDWDEVEDQDQRNVLPGVSLLGYAAVYAVVALLVALWSFGCRDL
jgi:hypothetical protein